MEEKYDLAKIAFKGEKRFLSNMYPVKIVFKLDPSQDLIANGKYGVKIQSDGLEYGSAEHIYQSLKSNDPKWKELVRKTETGEKVKSLARKHLGKKYEMREDWDDIKVRVMRFVIAMKFDQNQELKERLLDLEGEIVEENCWGDKFWGTVDGVGENYLGSLLMEYRSFRKLWR